MNASALLVTLFDVGSHAPRGSSSESRHVIHVHVRLSLSSPLSSSTSTCPSPSSPFFFPFLHFELHTELDNLIVMESLCYSANKGSDDAYDVSTFLTGYEPNYMAFSELNDSSGSFSYITPSSDQDMDDVALGKLLTEAHRGQADYCEPEGVSVSQSVVVILLCSMEQGNLWEKEMSISQLVLVSRETRTVLTANFLKTPKLKKWSIDQGNLRSKTAQMHRLGLYLTNRDK